MSAEMEGRTALVTGAAGGIGRAIATAFHDAGAAVVAVDLDAERLDELAGGRERIAPAVADISTPDGAAAAIAAAGDRLDVLCNNAGVLDGLATAEEVEPEVWDRVLRVNVTAPFLLCRAALPAMVAAGGGDIVNVASVGGLRGGRGGAAYTASKFGLVGLTQNIAASHGPRGIRCNAVCPGSTETGIRSGEAPSEWARRVRERDREKPAPGTPEQIAAVALFLCTPAAERINGAALPVDGGWIAY